MTIIKKVEAGSLADKAGIRGGDILISVNGHDVNDVLDYRFYLAEKKLRVKLRRGENVLEVTLAKSEYDDIGLEFDTPLMDKKHCCANKCIFCFIDQLPGGMRDTLYFKDDDSRLSFLHGNYITLTNLHDEDIDRIIKMRMSPLRVSVHTTNPELRVKMMKNKRAGEVLDYIGRVAKAGITIDAQIVLCKGINDRDELTRTMTDLCRYIPSLGSVSIVPCGLTKYRDDLYHIDDFSPQDAENVILLVEAMAQKCYEKYGSRIFFCADEFYLKAGHTIPDADYYEGFEQLEDGVGMLASFDEDFAFSLEDTKLPERLDRKVTVATGVAAENTIRRLTDSLCKRVPGLSVKVVGIKNNFFGESVTVAGLLTGKDIEEQLRDKELGELLIVPGVALRKSDEPVFLDDTSPLWLEQKLGVKVAPSNNADDLIKLILQ